MNPIGDKVDFDRCRLLVIIPLRYVKLMSITAIAKQLDFNRDTASDLLNSDMCRKLVAELIPISELKNRFSAMGDTCCDAIIECLQDTKDKNRAMLGFMVLRKILDAGGEQTTPAETFQPDWVQSDETK